MTNDKIESFREKTEEGRAFIERLNAAGVTWEDLSDPVEVQRKLDAHRSSEKDKR